MAEKRACFGPFGFSASFPHASISILTTGIGAVEKMLNPSHPCAVLTYSIAIFFSLTILIILPSVLQSIIIDISPSGLLDVYIYHLFSALRAAE